MATWLVGYEGEEDRVPSSAYAQEASSVLARSRTSFSDLRLRAEAEVCGPEVVRRVERYLFAQDSLRDEFLLVTREHTSYRYESGGTFRGYTEWTSRSEAVKRGSPEARTLLQKNFPRTDLLGDRLYGVL